MKKLFICLSLLLCLFTTSFAANWYWVGKSSNGYNYFIDNDTVMKNNKEAAVWVKITKPSGDTSLNRLWFKRDSHEYTLIEYIDYDSHGTITNSYRSSVANWSSVAPDSMSESIYYSIWSY